MTTQYTPILKLALPVQGELSGTWGDTVNDNITSMVEEAIAGRSVINSWTANSHTLTTADGTTAESRAMMLEFTDTGVALTGAGTVICPAASKVYVCKNSSGQVVTIKTSGGTGVAVPNGATTFVFCDGTNVEECVTNIVDVTVSGTITLASGVSVSAILDEDNMASNSATALATQQSIKAYVDSQVGSVDTLAEVLANGNTTGGTNIVVTAGDSITVDTIAETTAANGVVVDGVTLKDGGITVTADVVFGDNDKATFGAGDDLQIYHDGSNSYVQDAGSGYLVLGKQDTGTAIQNSAGQNLLITSANDVTLAYQNSAKLATTSTGINVTGTVTADGGLIGDAVSGSLSQTGMLTVSDTNSANTWANFTGTAAYLPFAHELAVVNLADATTNSFAGLYFMAGETSAASGISSARIGAVRTGASTADLAFSTRGGSDMNQAMRIAGNGDISFYEDTGTTAKFFWDASAESLGIGTTSPTGIQGGNVLEVSNATGSEVIVFRDDSSTQTNDFCGGFVIGNRDASGTPNHYAGMWADTDSFGQMTLQFAGGRDKYESGTADMVINSSGNVGIGTSSPAKTLDVNGEMQADIYRYPNANVGGIFDISGSNGIEFYGSTNAGANKLVAYTSGSERMRIDSSGNVGIGTTSPNAKFTNYKNTSVSGASGATLSLELNEEPRLLFTSDSASSYISSFDSNPITFSVTAGNFASSTGTERMRIDSSGNLLVGKTASNSSVAGCELLPSGIGALTANGNQALYLNRLTSDGAIVEFRKDGTTVGSIGVASSYLTIGSPVGSGGHLLIGNNLVHPATSTGASKDASIDIGGSSNRFKDLYLSGAAKIIGSTTGTSQIWLGDTADNNRGTIVYDHNTDHMSFKVNGAERYRVDSSGNLLVGVTSISDTTSRTYGNAFSGSGAVGNWTSWGSGSHTHATFRNGTGIVGTITTNGTTTAYNITSDERLKENIVDTTHTVDINDIKVRQYDWKSNGEHQRYGFIAQELEAVYPEAVHTPEDPELMKSVDYSKLVPLLVKEIQDLKAEVAALKGA